MKQITFEHIKLEKPTKTYSDLVNDVAKLINRPYPATLRMVQHLEPSQLQALYDDCLTKWRNRGFTSPSHMFWTERKKGL